MRVYGAVTMCWSECISYLCKPLLLRWNLMPNEIKQLDTDPEAGEALSGEDTAPAGATPVLFLLHRAAWREEGLPGMETQQGDLTSPCLCWHPGVLGGLVSTHIFRGTSYFRVLLLEVTPEHLKPVFINLLTQVEIRVNRPCHGPDQSQDRMADCCKHQDPLPVKHSLSLITYN